MVQSVTDPIVRINRKNITGARLTQPMICFVLYFLTKIKIFKSSPKIICIESSFKH